MSVSDRAAPPALPALPALTARALARQPLTRDEAVALLATPPEDVLDVVAAAARVRRAFFGNRVKVNYLVNLKSGICPEDCFYCSQRIGSTAEILRYTWLDAEAALGAAQAGIAAGARRVCLVGSGRGPSARDMVRITGAIDAIKSEHPTVEVCACFGLLAEGQAEQLRDAGADAYNHNLNTAEERYADICTTHEYSDRVTTIERARAGGLSPCSGLIVGMGESDEEIVDVVMALRDLGSESVPVNFLMPFEGTPLAGTSTLTPLRCLLILAVVRLVCPDVEVRMAGGREMHLRSLQPLALHVVNSLFLGDYLTSEGQPGEADLAMIADAGFVVEQPDDARAGSAAPRASGAPGAAPGAPAPAPRVAIRRRGAGTTAEPNA